MIPIGEITDNSTGEPREETDRRRYVETQVVPHFVDLGLRHDADVVLGQIDVESISRQDFGCQKDKYRN